MKRRVVNLLVNLLGRSGVTVYQWAHAIERTRRVERLAQRLAMACGVCRCGVPNCQPVQGLPVWAPSAGVVFDALARGVGDVLEAATPRICTVCNAARPGALCVGWSYTFEATGAGLAELASVCPNCAVRSTVGRAVMGSA